MNFGYWEKDDLGSLNYTSLSEESNIPLIEDEHFWNIIEMDGWVLFQSLQRIYLYHLDTREFRIIDAESTILKMMKVDNTIYFCKQGKGIYKIENGRSVLISDHTVFKNNPVVNIFKKQEDLLVLTQDDGFFILQHNQALKWNTDADLIISGKSVYSSIQLSNGDFVVGTISDGFFYLEKNGTVKYHMNQASGLGNNTVLAVFEDEDNNIWLGLDNGINSINITSPFKIFSNKDGKLGTIYASKVYKGYLYLGTNQGLFYKKSMSDDAFTFVKNTQGQVWNLTIIDNQLFCGHNRGTYLIENRKAIKIAAIEGTWGIKKTSRETFLQGNYNGLHILEKKSGKWRYRNKLTGFDNSSKHFEMIGNTIFVDHEYKGVFKLTANDSLTKILSVEKDTTVEKGIHSSLIQYQNKLLYANEKGVYEYDFLNNQFKKDALFSSLYDEKSYDSGKLIFNKNSLWVLSKENISYVSPDPLSNHLKAHKIPLTVKSKERGYWL